MANWIGCNAMIKYIKCLILKTKDNGAMYIYNRGYKPTNNFKHVSSFIDVRAIAMLFFWGISGCVYL